MAKAKATRAMMFLIVAPPGPEDASQKYSHPPCTECDGRHASSLFGSTSQAVRLLVTRYRATTISVANLKGAANYPPEMGDTVLSCLVDPTDLAIGDGVHTWTEDEVAQFIARHPPGTKPHLALMLMLWTGQRRGDVVRMAAYPRRKHRGAAGKDRCAAADPRTHPNSPTRSPWCPAPT
jgi:hypothetical protein